MVMSTTESVLRTLVGAARAAAVGRVGGRLALLDLERVPAPAGGGHIRVLDLEAGLLEPVQEVDRRALQVRRAVRVDHDVDAVERELVVTFLRAAVEAERVLEARAAAALDGDAKNARLALRLLGQEVAYSSGMSCLILSAAASVSEIRVSERSIVATRPW